MADGIDTTLQGYPSITLETEIDDMPQALMGGQYRSRLGGNRRTLADLVATSDSDLLRIPGFGRTGLKDVRALLAAIKERERMERRDGAPVSSMSKSQQRRASLQSETGSPPPAAVDTIGAATYTSVAVSTLENWRVAGVGPRFMKLGRAVRYRVADLDAWMAEQVVSSTSEVKV